MNLHMNMTPSPDVVFVGNPAVAGWVVGTLVFLSILLASCVLGLIIFILFQNMSGRQPGAI